MNPGEVRFRLLRGDDKPATNPDNLAYEFGLQDTKQVIVAGNRRADGMFVFDFTLNVKQSKDPGHPVFTGRFASGPVNDRFVYLSWKAIERSDYISRIKARLGAVDWKMVLASQEQDKPITADMTGWTPHDTRKQVVWYL
jgi:hypothetical protein